MKVFIDSNIPMYVAGQEHPNRAPAMRFMRRARDGEFEVCTSTEVLQEVLYRYAGLCRLDLAAKVYDYFVALVPEILDVTLADTDLAKHILVSTAGISARDAVHAAVMKNHEVDRLATFDRGFDRLGWVRRLELD